MIRRSLLTALVAGLAACSNNPRLPTVTMSGCDNFGGNFAVPFDQAEAAMPVGYEPLPTTGGSANGAVFFILSVHCDAGAINGSDVGPVQLAYAELAARPLEGSGIDGIGDFTVPVLFTATPDAVANAFAGYALGDVGPGTITRSDTPDGTTTVEFTRGDAMVTLSGNVPAVGASSFGAGEFALLGVESNAIQHVVLGRAGPSTADRGPVTLQTSGGPALLGAAARSANGFASRGFTLDFSELLSD